MDKMRLDGKIDQERSFSRMSSSSGAMPDEEIVSRICAGDTALFESILRRYNQRLYRVAMAILADDAEALDAVQSTYLRAYTYLSQFDGRSSFGTWLTRIAINEARRRAHPRESVPLADESHQFASETYQAVSSAEHQVFLGEMRKLLESAVEQLPEAFRTVFMLRDVRQLTTGESAELLDIPEATVKTRLYRAHRLLRRQLSDRLGSSVPHLFELGGVRCDQLVEEVMTKIGQRTL